MRNLGLDVCRAAAILAVVISHLLPLAWPNQETLLFACQLIGQLGVELFFSLSGFLIGKLLIRLAMKLTLREIKKFMARRFLRTLPLYYIALLGMSFLTGIWEWRPFLFLQNFQPAFLPDRPSPLVVGWSLVLEEWFYFFFPWLLLVASSTLPRMTATAVVAITACGLLMLCFSLRVAFQNWGPDPTFHAHPIMRLDCAAFGVLAACIGALKNRRQLWFSGAIAMIAAWTALEYALKHPSFWIVSSAGAWFPLYAPLRWSIPNATFAVIVLIASATTIKFPRGITIAITTISILSYSIYLGHVAVRDLILPWAISTFGIALGLSVVFVGIVALAAATYLGVERPFMRLRDQYFPGSPPLARVENDGGAVNGRPLPAAL